ncbi:unnamed protein product [Strongylus vulgaris]|uniref:Uncharacterized protein n=1 Tax=Strongylus vulgaris TaxID=40348 RepID=A0A3P7J8D2_STRVU|nr:unnamed protein product [Strongylus vulgaris]
MLALKVFAAGDFDQISLLTCGLPENVKEGKGLLDKVNIYVPNHSDVFAAGDLDQITLLTYGLPENVKEGKGLLDKGLAQGRQQNKEGYMLSGKNIYLLVGHFQSTFFDWR